MSDNLTIFERINKKIRLTWYKSCSALVIFWIVMLSARAVTAVQDVILDEIAIKYSSEIKQMLINRSK